MIASMRSALWISFAALLAALAAPIAHAQINPKTGIKWPPCTGLNQVYSIVTNTCIATGSGGGGGSPNPPNGSIQFAIGSLFGSDPNITIDAVLHAIHVGAPNSNPSFFMKPLGTIASNWTFDITSPNTGINSLTGPGTESYVWTYHSGIGQWRPSATANGVTAVVPGTGTSCTPFVSGQCVGNVTVNATASAPSFASILGGTNSAAAMIVAGTASIAPSGSGKITATHSTQTGLIQCLNAAVDGAFVGSGAVCNAFAALISGTNSSAALVIATGASLGHTGTGIIDASSINGVAVTGTAAAGKLAIATGASAATWQTPGTALTSGTNGFYTIDLNGTIDEDVNTGALNNNTPTTVTLPHAIPTTFASCVCSDNGARVQSGNDQPVGCNISGQSAPFTSIQVNTPATTVSAYCRVRGK